MSSKKNTIALSKLSKNLKTLRTEKKYTQMYISIQTGIDISLYQKYESNNPPNIRLTNLLKILAFYNIKLEELLK